MARSIKEIEKKLWEAADELRGNMSAEEYMHTILGILTLKYITDKFEIAKNKILKEEKWKSIEEYIKNLDRNEFFYAKEAFIVGEKSHWQYLMQFANTSSIGAKIDQAFTKLETTNPMLKGIFNKNYNRESLDQTKLGAVVRIFSDENLAEQEEDLIGRIYEYFLGHFFKDRGQKGGEFYTPKTIVKLMVNLIKPIKGTIYDPACGTGGILIQSKKYIQSHGGNMDNITIYGQEFNNVTWKLAKLNLLLNGFPLVDDHGNGLLGNRSADTFLNDQHRDKHFNFVMANPPFNMKKWGQEQLVGDARWKWGTPPKGNANYGWISHIISKLSANGKAAIVLANGSLSSMRKDELKIRENLIAANKVDVIISLPNKLFYTTGIPACIWIFNNNKKNKRVLMLDASQKEGKLISKVLRELKNEDIEEFVTIYEKHSNNEIVNVKGLAKNVLISEIVENDYSFVPGRYLEQLEEIIDVKKTKEEIKKLQGEIIKLVDEFKQLTPKVLESIKKGLEYKKDDKK